MGRLKDIAVRALGSGSTASVASTMALALCGVRECGSAYAPVNAVSHWLWREPAIHKQSASLRHTVAGYLIHHTMSVLWALAFERLLPRKFRQSPAQIVVAGATVSAAACVVDLKLTPRRLTPGFERRLGNRSLTAVYVAFGAGLVLAHYLRARTR